jgi:hypothetical protein
MFYYSVIRPNRFVNLYFNCKAEASTSVLPFYIILVLPNNGRNNRPKHVVVNVFYYSEDQ